MLETCQHTCLLLSIETHGVISATVLSHNKSLLDQPVNQHTSAEALLEKSGL
jgi:hypothetical protein